MKMDESKMKTDVKGNENRVDAAKMPDRSRFSGFKGMVASLAVVGTLAGMAACDNKTNGNGDAGVTLDASGLDANVDGGQSDGGLLPDGGVEPELCAKTEKGMAHLSVPVKWGQFGSQCLDVASGCMTGVEAGDVLTFTNANNTVENWEVTGVSDLLGGTVTLANGSAVIEVNPTGSVHIENNTVQPTALTGRGILTVTAACVSGNCFTLSSEVPERKGMALVEVSQGAEVKKLLLSEGDNALVTFDNGVSVALTLRRATAQAAYVSYQVTDGVQSDGEALAQPLGEGATAAALGVSVKNAVSVDNNDGPCVTKSVTISDVNGGTTYQRAYAEGETFTTMSGVQLRVEKVMVETDSEGNVVSTNSAVKLVKVSDNENVVLYGGNAQHNVNGSTLTVLGFGYVEIQPNQATPDAGVPDAGN